MSRTKRDMRNNRHRRVRRKVIGTTARPRLCVFRSLKHIYAQIIDDSQGVTLVAASTAEPEIRGEVGYGGNVDAARKVGEIIAKRAKDKGISKIAFDRGGYLYHGRVAALADGARAGGLEF